VPRSAAWQGGCGVRSDSLQLRAIRNDDYCILVVDVFHNFGQIAHIEPLPATT